MGKLVTNQFNGKAVTALAELPLWQRLELAHRQLEPVQSNYRIVFESDLDHPAAVLIPDPNWLACALQGGFCRLCMFIMTWNMTRTVECSMDIFYMRPHQSQR